MRKYTDIISIHNSIVVDGKDGEPGRMERPPNLMSSVPFNKIRKWEESFGGGWARRQIKLVDELIAEEIANDDSTQPTSPMSESEQ